MPSENAANLPHRESVIERLRSFMTAHGLTHEELARLLGITPETLEDWFSAGSAPPGALLALLILLPTVLSQRSIPSVSRTTSRFPGSTIDSRPSNTQEQQLLRMVRAI